MWPFRSEDWDKSLTGTGRQRGSQQKRDNLKASIGRKLREIQYPHCIYCGIHENLVGNLQRDHIAPRNPWIEFVFEAQNLVLACASCNGFLKKNNFDTISSYSTEYKKCKFNIIHPYFDKYQDHIHFSPQKNKIIIYPKRNSRKGKKTIQVFELNNTHQVSLRCASSILNSFKLTKSQNRIFKNIVNSDYN